jgi:hypothetical protein
MQDESLMDRVKASSAIMAVASDPSFEHMLPEVKTLMLNKERQLRGLEPVDAWPDPQTAGQYMQTEVLTGKGLVRRIPFAGSAYEAAELFNVYEAAKRLNEGKEKPDDIQTLVNFQEHLAREAVGRTWGGDVTALLADNLPFMAEFIASGMAIGGIKRVAMRKGRQMARRQVQETLEQAIKKLGTKEGLKRFGKRIGVGTVERLPFFAGRAEKYAVQRMIPEFQLEAGPEGRELIYLQAHPGEGPLEAQVAGWADMAIEIFSEQTGEAVAAFVSPIRRALKRRVPKLPVMRIGVRDFLARVGWHGTLEEMTEERIGEILREAVSQAGLVDIGEGVTIPGMPGAGRRLGTEAAAFAVPGVARRALAAVRRGRRRNGRGPGRRRGLG